MVFFFNRYIFYTLNRLTSISSVRERSQLVGVLPGIWCMVYRVLPSIKIVVALILTTRFTVCVHVMRAILSS